jgi:hypothetical protein
MSEIQLVHLSFGGESRDRSRIHETAMRDARFATEHHEGSSTPPARPSLRARLGLGSRLRVVLASGPETTAACSCPA